MRAQRYRKKPVETEAMRWTGDNLEALIDWTAGDLAAIHPEDRTEDPDAKAQLWVAANRRWLPLSDGEWVAKDRHGFYPIKADVFDESYELVQDSGDLTSSQCAGHVWDGGES